MSNHRWIYPAFGMLMSLMFVYFALVNQTRKESFYGMSPGTLTQLQSSHVPNTLLVREHRFKPYDTFGAENQALTQTPQPYLIY